GCVVDFFHLDIGAFTIAGRTIQVFPIGNIADLAIIAGVVGVLLSQKAFQRFILERETAALPVPTTPEAGPVATEADSTPPTA
ncbi:MAG: hypothetical protein AAF791_06900, partial [Bacteroidota bacterium]